MLDTCLLRILLRIINVNIVAVIVGYIYRELCSSLPYMVIANMTEVLSFCVCVFLKIKFSPQWHANSYDIPPPFHPTWKTHTIIRIPSSCLPSFPSSTKPRQHWDTQLLFVDLFWLTDPATPPSTLTSLYFHALLSLSLWRFTYTLLSTHIPRSLLTPVDIFLISFFISSITLLPSYHKFNS